MNTGGRLFYIALTASAVCGAVMAQQQATFTVRSITPESALRAAQAAMQSCARTGYQVAIAVSDRAGNPLVMLRDRLAGPHTPEAAMNKAYTAVTFKMDTLTFGRATQATESSSGIRQLPRIIAMGGGLPIESAGALVGGIGVSGAPGGDADDVCARAGIAAIKDDLEF
ncbi:MAG: heme-binding protein [Burkholderiaceae bacterium]|nr:heme-binding protein [Burkholderiaceae bacterium]